MYDHCHEFTYSWYLDFFKLLNWGKFMSTNNDETKVTIYQFKTCIENLMSFHYK